MHEFNHAPLDNWDDLTPMQQLALHYEFLRADLAEVRAWAAAILAGLNGDTIAELGISNADIAKLAQMSVVDVGPVGLPEAAREEAR